MANSPKPTTFYLRVSTRNQVGEDRFGLDVQLRDAQFSKRRPKSVRGLTTNG
ncbi:hypothetical protein [Deinococcus sp. QL22]|uniref:hypothetical protein n=1 Tax=Deinococcus sp. QL22 TaxID=2939437 RepID=UPI00201836EF|nr:hypothetical protein [Deinococcus sp. QL22]UQN06331.1 hypothetical protein M1R55_15950 [Deinococcus sp. QL22]